MFYKKAAIKNLIFTGKHLCWMLSSKYCEIFENTYYEEHLRTAASVRGLFLTLYFIYKKTIKNDTDEFKFSKQFSKIKIKNNNCRVNLPYTDLYFYIVGIYKL